MQSSHCLADIGEWFPFDIHQQRRRSGYWIRRIQYMLPDNDILTYKLMDMGLKSDNPWGLLGRLMVCNPDYVIYLTRLLVPDWLGSVKLCLPKVLNHGRSLGMMNAYLRTDIGIHHE